MQHNKESWAVLMTCQAAVGIVSWSAPLPAVAAKSGNTNQSLSGISLVNDLNQGILSKSITLGLVLEEEHFVLLELPISTSFQHLSVEL